ncbi:hypothetical protein [Streptosporangium sandarakinum]|uniref:hypothetical protein n=1 Tax=Streptosporangium sandarakinum TaxID=1260955 RepID=UPI003792A96A
MGALEEKVNELWEAARHISNAMGCGDGARVGMLVDKMAKEGRGERTDPGDLLLLALGEIALERLRAEDPGYHIEAEDHLFS